MRDWRQRSGRVEARPTSVVAVVRGTRAALRAAHAVESGLLSVAAALLVRAAAVLSGAEGAESWAVALVAGALAGAAWWREHGVRLAPTAAELDRRLRHRGALVTAFELEGRCGRRSPMETLVCERVLASLRPREAREVLAPPLLFPLAAPLLAALALVLVLDARRSPRVESSDLVRLTRGLEDALAGSGVEVQEAVAEGELSPGEGNQALRRLAARQEVLQRTLERGAGERGAARQALEELDHDLAALEAGLPSEGPLRERIEEARTWIDALRMGIEPQEEGPGVGPGPGREGMAMAEGTSGRPEGTISGSLPIPQGPQTDSPVPPPRSATDGEPEPAPPASLGAAGANWWPPEYDGVVERWIELRRAALAGEPR